MPDHLDAVAVARELRLRILALILTRRVGWHTIAKAFARRGLHITPSKLMSAVGAHNLGEIDPLNPHRRRWSEAKADAAAIQIVAGLPKAQVPPEVMARAARLKRLRMS